MPKHVTEEYLDRRFDVFGEELDKKFVTKDEFHGRMDDMMQKMDGMVTILQRLDQERVFMTEWVRRIEADVSQVKRHLNLA